MCGLHSLMIVFALVLQRPEKSHCFISIRQLLGIGLKANYGFMHYLYNIMMRPKAYSCYCFTCFDGVKSS